MTSREFIPFPKIPRLNREVVITEKIDGTNAQIVVTEDGLVLAGSRTRWITPEQDNMGFAKWVKAHEDELRNGLGIGQHFGEWWGNGIQRGYGLKEKKFSLFNAGRWSDENTPSCCSVVPVLYKGAFSTDVVTGTIHSLKINGSYAAPGYMNPEGVVVYHTASNELFKVLCENDELPKGLVA